MLVKNITYDNPFNGEKVTETHHFHISKADLVEMELEEHKAVYTAKDGEELTGMRAKLQSIMDSQDGRDIMDTIKDIIARAYGVKVGDKFLKTKEAREEFVSSEAFSQLFFELCTQPEATAEFIRSVVPHNLEQIAQEVQEQAEKIAAGREAQETAKAAAGTPEEARANEGLSEGTATVMEKLTPPAVQQPLADRIALATAENPITLTQAEVGEIDSDELKSGLATGRIKLS